MGHDQRLGGDIPPGKQHRPARRSLDVIRVRHPRRFDDDHHGVSVGEAGVEDGVGTFDVGAAGVVEQAEQLFEALAGRRCDHPGERAGHVAAGCGGQRMLEEAALHLGEVLFDGAEATVRRNDELVDSLGQLFDSLGQLVDSLGQLLHLAGELPYHVGEGRKLVAQQDGPKLGTQRRIAFQLADDLRRVHDSIVDPGWDDHPGFAARAAGSGRPSVGAMGTVEGRRGAAHRRGHPLGTRAATTWTAEGRELRAGTAEVGNAVQVVAGRVLAGDGAGDPAARLAVTKRNATALLVVAAAVYVASTVWLGPSVLRGFLRAASEAAMVGGLADWFAVTALFRRPLGLPIPHTALVPRKKDELAAKLGDFVTGYFLTPAALDQQVVDSRLVDRVGRWLAEPSHAEQLSDAVSSALSAALGSFDTVGVEDAVADLLRRQRGPRSFAPALGRLLGRAVAGGAERPLVDLLTVRAREHLASHRAALHPVVKRFIVQRNWLTALLTTDRLVSRLLRDAEVELARIEREADHPVRVALEDLLARVAQDLREDPDAAARVDALVDRLLDDPQAAAAVRSMVGDALDAVRASLADPASPLAARLADAVAHLGKRAFSEPRFHDEIEGALRRVVGWAVGRYGGEVTTLIRHQVEAWPAQAASRRIELAVGRDLQYIRVNGTVVGALAGLAIHAVGLLLP